MLPAPLLDATQLPQILRRPIGAAKLIFVIVIVIAISIPRFPG